jgi:hypothetical protein
MRRVRRAAWLAVAVAAAFAGCGDDDGGDGDESDGAVDGPDGAPVAQCPDDPPVLYDVCPTGCESFGCDDPCVRYCGLTCAACGDDGEWETRFIECDCAGGDDAGPDPVPADAAPDSAVPADAEPEPPPADAAM